MALLIRHYWKPYFNERRLIGIRKNDLQAFSLWLKEEKHLKGKTVNNCLAAGTVALRWAHQNEIILANPAEGLMKFSGKAARRGVLTEAEVKRLFAVPWADERAYLGNAVAMSTGLRSGEVLGLQVRDIEDNRLHIRHSWSNIDKLKATKTGAERAVPLLPELQTRLLELAKKNPHGIGPCSFVYWSATNSDRPMDAHGLADPLKEALLGLSLTKEERKDSEKVKKAVEYWRSRRISYHSWRHLWAARMADRLEARKVMSATGHKSGAVFEVYADHVAEKTLMEVQEVSEDTFGRLLPFRTVSDVLEESQAEHVKSYGRGG
jgi:integrase